MTTKAQPRGFSFCEANGFRALIFDWDGVLLDSGQAYYLGYERVLEEAGIATSPREIYLREGEPTAQLLAHMFEARCTPVNHLRAVETLGLAPRQCLVMENAPLLSRLRTAPDAQRSRSVPHCRRTIESRPAESAACSATCLPRQNHGNH